MTITRPRGLGKRASLMTRLLRSLLIGLAKFRIFNVLVINREVVPKTGSIIIACNHISIADPVYLWGALRRNAVALAMAELWKKWYTSWVFRTLGHIPVERGNRASGAKAIEASLQVLDHDGALLIFPEGKCAHGTSMLPFKPGVAEISFQTRTPVIPAAVIGTNLVKPLRSPKVNRRELVIVKFGEPLYPGDYASPRDMLAAIEHHISLLSGRPKAVNT